MLQQLTPRVYQLDFSQEQDRPVLGYIRGDRFSLMVDAGNSPEHVQAYLAAVEESGFCQPDFVALTHSHWDHCFGLASLPMPSIACVQTRQSLEMVSRLQWTPDALAENVRKGIVPQLCAPRIQLHFPDPESIRVALPTMVFSESMTLDLGNCTCELRHVTSAHARDTVIVWVKEEQMGISGGCGVSGAGGRCLGGATGKAAKADTGTGTAGLSAGTAGTSKGNDKDRPAGVVPAAVGKGGAVMTDAELARAIAEKAAEQGGTVYFVGGCVRDRLLGLENKDIDIEVHGIPAEALEQLLSELGACMKIGKSFGIYGLKGHALDIALPRTERRTGVGHRDFAVTSDPFLGTYEAAKRRDFTMNALMQNVLTGEIIDHFGGRQDLQDGVLRHVDDVTFTEDPLRVLRAAQFAARFQFSVAAETVKLCRRIDCLPFRENA